MDKKIFKRKIYNKILDWKQRSNGKTALLIEGPRRVGKSTIVAEFAKREYESHIIIDFNKASQSIKDLFADLTDLDYLFLFLQTTYHVSLKNRNSLIVFDEVQKCPLARQAIKYLVEDGRYDFIETGSLISIKKNTESITIPSEEERISMHPMDFEEFQDAIGNGIVYETLKKFWDSKLPLGNLHRQIMREFRLYMLVGGMPQAVEEYIDSNDFKKVDAVKRRIIRLYEEDFLKVDPSGKLSDMFLSIPSQLSRNASRFYPYPVIGSQSEDTLRELVRALADSKTVNVCYNCTDPGVGMSLNKDENRFKLFVMDTGLFITMVFWDKEYVDNVIYEKLLSDKLPSNLGYIYENMTAQILTGCGLKLFYYAWKKDDRHYYEIDFLISEGSKISPIEVKSSGYAAHSSLDAFYDKYSSRIYCNYLLTPKEFARKEFITIIPPYFLPFIL